jgi:hypothetical protein
MIRKQARLDKRTLKRAETRFSRKQTADVAISAIVVAAYIGVSVYLFVAIFNCY